MNQQTEDMYTIVDILVVKSHLPKPKIVVLCGSSRFSQAFQQANLQETLAGHIVLTIGCDTKSDDALRLGIVEKLALDVLHFCKIDLADEVFILNVDGYIGTSTAREIIYAKQLGKPIRWLVERSYEQER